MSEYKRPLPQPTALSAPHWEGAQQHRLMVQRCAACAHHVFPPKPVCDACFSQNLTWVQSSGRGAIYSYTIVHRPPDPSFAVPFCAAIIALEEGWYMLSNVVNIPMEAIAVGLPVKVCFVEVDGMSLPVFSWTNTS